MTHSQTKIVAFVGMPGSGKSTAVEHLTQKLLPKVHFGTIVLQAIEDAGLVVTESNEAHMRETLRQQKGDDFIAQQIIEQINRLVDAGQHHIVADGLYSWTEFKALKHAFPGELSVIAVLASGHIRHHRLANRPDHPLTAEQAKTRDWSEIEHLEKGGPIAMADRFIVNEGTLDQYLATVTVAAQEIGI